MAQQELRLRINSGTVLKGQLFAPDAFKDLTSSLSLVEKNPEHPSILKKYQNNQDRTIIEFYNGSAVLFEESIDLVALKNVEFNRILYSNTPDEITFLISIDSSFYESLKSEIVEQVKIPNLNFFGEFFKLSNGNILVQWQSGFRPSGPYAILKDLKTMASIDPELLDFIEEKQSDSKASYPERSADYQFEEIGFSLKNTNSGQFKMIRDRLSKLLRIDTENLDFSMRSIDQIDKSFMWNADKLNQYELLDLCYPYVGEVLRRAYDLKWIEQNNYPTLVDKNFKETDFLLNLQRAIIDPGLGIPQVKWVVQTLEDQIK